MENTVNKSLYIPAKQRWKGLTVYCYRCQTNVSEICGETEKSLKSCPFGDRHVFKAYIHVPGTANARKTKVLGRDLTEAIKLAMDFEREVKAGKHQNGEDKGVVKIGGNGSIKPQSLAGAMSRYVGILCNDPELVPEFRRVEYSKKHIADVKRTFRYYAACMKKNKRDFNSIGLEISEQELGKFHEYLLKDLGLSNRSYNKTLTIFTTFFNQLIEEGYFLKNPFKTIPRKAVVPKVETITEEEYRNLLKIVQKPELGKCRAGKEMKDLFRSWMKDAIEIGLMSCRRNEEIVQMKWGDILLDKNGNPYCIKVQDFKVNRQRGSEKENIKYIYVPVTDELNDLLMRMGYEKYKDSGKYILAPEETMNRETLNRFMSRSFTHYYRQLNTGRDLSYKVLRKTYITSLTKFMGVSDARLVTRHGGTQVMQDHYIDQKAIAITAKKFSVFGQNENRQNELEKIRNSNHKIALENER